MQTISPGNNLLENMNVEPAAEQINGCFFRDFSVVRRRHWIPSNELRMLLFVPDMNPMSVVAVASRFPDYYFPSLSHRKTSCSLEDLGNMAEG